MDDDLDLVDEDDLIDEHLFDLDGCDLDGTGNRWAYPFSQSIIPHNWISRRVQGTHHSGSGSRYRKLPKFAIIAFVCVLTIHVVKIGIVFSRV